jgi:hypothetical protein
MTLTLEYDVQALLKQAMQDIDASFKQVVNDAFRKGLRPDLQSARQPFVQMTFDTGRPLVDLTKAAALADELDDQGLAARLLASR